MQEAPKLQQLLEERPEKHKGLKISRTSSQTHDQEMGKTYMKVRCRGEEPASPFLKAGGQQHQNVKDEEERWRRKKTSPLHCGLLLPKSSLATSPSLLQL